MAATAAGGAGLTPTRGMLSVCLSGVTGVSSGADLAAAAVGDSHVSLTRVNRPRPAASL